MAGCTDNDGSNELSIVLPSGEKEMAQRKVDQCWTGHDKGKVSSDIWATRCWKK